MSARLERSLSLPGAIGLTVGFVVGGSIYVLIPTLADYKTGIVFLGIWLIGIAYWYWRKSYLKKRGIILEDKLREISTAGLLELEDSDA